MDWFRWYHGTVNDPKWRVIAKRAGCTVADVIAVWATMLESASDRTQANARERGELSGWCVEDVSALLDIEPEQIEAIRKAMQGKVLDGEKLTGWDKRQPKREDGSAERARAWREKKKAESHPPDDGPNASERKRTLEEKREEKSRGEEISTSVIKLSAREPMEVSADEIMLAANRGMKDNSAIRDAYTPISIGHGSRQDVLDWLAQGVPADVAQSTVYERARDWKPSGTRRQITSMKYFTDAVTEAFVRHRAAQARVPNGSDHRGAGSEAPSRPGADRKPGKFAHLVEPGDRKLAAG